MSFKMGIASCCTERIFLFGGCAGPEMLEPDISLWEGVCVLNESFV